MVVVWPAAVRQALVSGPHAVADAVALAPAVVQVGGQGLRVGAAGGGGDHVLDVGVMGGGVQHLAVGGVAGDAGPGGGGHGGEAAIGGRRHTGVHDQRAGLPDLQEAGDGAHAGIGLQRGVAGVAALVGSRVVDERRHGGRVLDGGGVGGAETGGGRGQDGHGVVVPTVAAASGHQEAGQQRQRDGPQRETMQGRAGGDEAGREEQSAHEEDRWTGEVGGKTAAL